MVNSDSLEKYGFEDPFEPDQLLTRALEYIKGSKNVLDVGCGEGADSVFFAKHGLQVKAIDQNEPHLDRLRSYATDHQITNIDIEACDIINYSYTPDHYDIISCLLVGCCMRKSEFEQMLSPLKQAVKINGIVIMSLRNYLDVDCSEFLISKEQIEPNTFVKGNDCCQIRYFIEEGRLKEHFKDFEIIYYFEGMYPDKYGKVSEHGDSFIICRRIGNNSIAKSHD